MASSTNWLLRRSTWHRILKLSLRLKAGGLMKNRSEILMRILLATVILPLISWSIAYPAEGDGRTDCYGDPLPEHALARCGTVRWLPLGESIGHMVFSPDGTLLATLSDYRFGDVRPGVQVWQVETGKPIGPAAIAEREVTGVAWSSDSKRIAICDAASLGKATVEIWNVATGRKERTLTEESEPFWCVAWSPDGKHISAGQKEGRTFVWEAASGRLVYRLDAPSESLSFSRNSEILLTGDEEGLTLWNVGSGAKERRLEVAWGFGLFPHPCLSPDLRTIAVCRKKGLQLLDVGTGELSEPFDGEPTTASSLAFSPDGKRVAGATFDREVYVWDVETRKEIRSFEPGGFAVAISPDGRTLAFQQRRIVLVNIETGRWREFESTDAAGVLRVVLSPDGKTAMAGGLSSIARSWDIETGRQLREFDHRRGTTIAIALSPDGKLLACGGSEGVIHLWDVQAGKPVTSFAAAEAAISSLAFSPNQAELVSTSLDSVMRFWDLRTFGELEHKRDNLGLREPEFTEVRFSPDGKTLAVARHRLGAVELWNAVDWKHQSVLLTGGTSLFLPIAFSPDSSRLAMPESFSQIIPRGRIRSRIKIIDVKTEEKVGATAGAREMISAVAFSPDGRMLATADKGFGEPASLDLWSAKTGTKLLSLNGHQDYVRSLTFTPDSSRLVSASEDTTLLLWDLSAARESLERQEGDRDATELERD